LATPRAGALRRRCDHGDAGLVGRDRDEIFTSERTSFRSRKSPLVPAEWLAKILSRGQKITGPAVAFSGAEFFIYAPNPCKSAGFSHSIQEI